MPRPHDAPVPSRPVIQSHLVGGLAPIPFRHTCSWRPACGTGLSIQRADYVRVVNSRQTLVTGTTRDATLWIEHGRIAARVPQFRFTLRLADLLGNVEVLGSRRERGDSVFMESVVAPAMLVSALPVQVVVAN